MSSPGRCGLPKEATTTRTEGFTHDLAGPQDGTEGNSTMELKVNIQVSVDGVYQSNGGRHPDFDPGMERGRQIVPLARR